MRKRFVFHPSVKRELPEHIRLVISGLDNGEALYHVWLFSIRNNIPHVDGSTFERSTHCYVFPSPREGPCYLCTTPTSFYETISASYSCTRNTTFGEIAPSYALTSKLAGDLVFTEACKLLRGEKPDYNEIRMVVNNWHFEREGILPSKTHRFGHITFGVK